MNLKKKKVLIFDLDGTLAESKQPLDPEMAWLLAELLEDRKVAVISGGSFEQFKRQFIASLPQGPVKLENLFLFPATATSFYRYEGSGWEQVYGHALSAHDKKRIISALEHAEAKAGIAAHKTYGQKIEDRGTQVTYSGLGQEAPLKEKLLWDPHQAKRKKMAAYLELLIPDFSAKIGGTTSIDVTHKGIDKAYGIHQIEHVLSTPIKDMAFVGDAIFPGGNDYAALSTGIDCSKVKDVEATKRLIQGII